MYITENVSLKNYNTFHIDVSAKYFVQCNTTDNFLEILKNERFNNETKLILGGGSNVLFTKDFDGIVLHNNLKGISIISENDDEVIVEVAAGEVWHQFVMWCVERNYGGLENLSLIPGSAGAGPMQNIGAYGVELKDSFVALNALHIQSLEVLSFSNSDCKFGYRQSVFKNEVKGQYIILSVTFKLKKNPVQFNTSYGAIETELKNMNVDALNVKNISQAVINIRKSKLPDPAELGNAGSFFKNPEVTEQHFLKLKSQFSNLPAYDTKPGYKKLAAGWLIEQCGWKGKIVGNTGSHKMQALVLVNYGNATGTEVFQLAKDIQQSVKDRFDTELEMEVNLV